VIENLPGLVESKRFLGREFLTWLVHRIEETGGGFELEDGPVEVQLGDRLHLAGGIDKTARLTVVGEGDVRHERGAGLRRGKLIDRARLVLRRAERRWEVTLDGGVLEYASLRCPSLDDRDRSVHDDPRAVFENDLFLRLADVEEVIGVIDALFAAFCRLRATDSWSRHTVPELRGWVESLT
jgi:hypothetical protein